MSQKYHRKIRMAEIYPGLTAEELVEAEENLRRYVAAIKQIFNYDLHENPKILTELRKRATLRRKVIQSSPSQTH